MAKDTAPLKLRAFDLEDLSVVSGLVQDALVPMGDMLYLPDEGRFILAMNRFRWEADDDGPPYSRTHAGLRFDMVSGVARRNLAKSDHDRMLELLSVAFHGNTVMLSFSGGPEVRLEVESLAAALEDLGEPWPTPWMPGHELDED